MCFDKNESTQEALHEKSRLDAKAFVVFGYSYLDDSICSYGGFLLGI